MAQQPMADRVRTAVTRHLDAGELPGAAWCVTDGTATARGQAGSHGPGGESIGPDTIFRLSSMTKPVTAAAAMTLIDDGTLTLDTHLDQWLPELANRRVVADPGGPLTDTVPAGRPITVRDVLEFRLGLGLDFTVPWPNPFMEAMAEAGLPVGPPAPQAAPEPDEWLRRVGTLPLAHQPGERWLYHTGAGVLGVLISRASGIGLPELLADRIFGPLGMTGTGFWVPDDQLARFGPHWVPGDHGSEIYDPADGQWAAPPDFPDGGDGLVSTIADYAAFAGMLRDGGVANGHRVLTERAVQAMTTLQVPAIDDEGGGWGLGLGVRRADERRANAAGVRRHAGSYGWDGGLGSSWWTDPVTGVTAILLTNQMWTSPVPSAVFVDFWDAAFSG